MTCKFYHSARGCRSGSGCPFIHRAQPRRAVAQQRTKDGTSGSLRNEAADEPSTSPSATPMAGRRKAKPADKWVVKKNVPVLPEEMWSKILKHCDPSALAAVCRVCKWLRQSALQSCHTLSIDASKLDGGSSPSTSTSFPESGVGASPTEPTLFALQLSCWIGSYRSSAALCS